MWFGRRRCRCLRFSFLLWPQKRKKKKKRTRPDSMTYDSMAIVEHVNVCVCVRCFFAFFTFRLREFRILLFWISGVAWHGVACVRCVPCLFDFGANAFTLTYHIFAFTFAAQHTLPDWRNARMLRCRMPIFSNCRMRKRNGIARRRRRRLSRAVSWKFIFVETPFGLELATKRRDASHSFRLSFYWRYLCNSAYDKHGNFSAQNTINHNWRFIRIEQAELCHR